MEKAPHFYAKDRMAWSEWLAKNHFFFFFLLLVYDKGANRTIAWQDIVQEALCFGWIDSRPGKISDTQSKIYVCKRKPKSVWSKINKANIDELLANKQMMPAGLAAVKRAKENGSWDALNASDNLILPAELKSKFDKNPKALANYNAFSASTKRNTLQWIYDAKTDTTRTKRIDVVVDSAAQNIKLR